jgi:hypothetical protein
MQASYRHRQVSRPTVVSFIALTVLLSLPFFLEAPRLILFAAIAPIYALAALVHWLLYSMTIEVSGQELRWHFGPGFWRKRIALADIARVKRVRLPWWYGIGIRYTPPAWTYLVAPGGGIEVETTSNKIVRVGTDDAERLMGALASR